MVTWAASLSSFAQSPIREIDEAVDRFMQITAATSATIAVSVSGDMVLSQGYGFADSKQRVPTRPVATMRLASCTKPFTRVAIGKLVEGGQLAWDANVFELLSIEPHPNRPVVDPRLHQITLQHLIEHRGGWDRTEFDVMYELDQIKNEMDLSRPLEKRDLVQYMLGRPLPFEPGETKHYSNFGYVLLGMAIEKVSGKSYIEAIRELVGRPLGIDDLAISSTRRKHRHPREVFDPRDSPLDLRLRDSSRVGIVGPVAVQTHVGLLDRWHAAPPAARYVFFPDRRASVDHHHDDGTTAGWHRLCADAQFAA